MRKFLNYWSLIFMVYTSLMVGFSFGQVGQVLVATPIDEYTALIVFVKMVVPMILGVLTGVEATKTVKQ